MPVVRKAPLDLAIHTKRTHRQFAPYLRKHLLAAHVILKPSIRELSLALVGDRKMTDLHQQFMGITGPTDVLTFPLDSDKRGRVLTGEVVICVSEARRRSRENGPVTTENLRKELLLYALHGLLHLCGYDDRTDRDFKKMHRMEDRILCQLGVGPVFAA